MSASPANTLYDTAGIHFPYAVISSAARNLFRPPFPASFAKPFRRSTAPPFLRDGVSRFSLSNTHRLTANEKDPSASLGMTIRETCFLTHSLYDTWDIHSPRCHQDIHSPHCHFERSEKSFSSPLFPPPSLSLLREAPSAAFPAIRCFPFLAVKHSPSYRQRKRSLDFARDDDTG